jgi:4-amino-4-deoxy-L-arabinose transferase-like glycosyltransferase
VTSLALALPRRSIAHSYAWVALIFTLVYAVYVMIAPPQREFPLNDDWGYAQSVEHLLDTGELRVSEWASATTIFQIYWGGLFAQLTGGFSFSALRGSTLAFSFIGCIALYDLLRQLDLPAPAAFLGGLALAVNPMFTYLSYTFMSDVFYFGLMLLSLSFYVRGIKRDAGGALFIGSVFAAGAFLSRQLGIVLPAAAGLALLLKDRRLRWKPLALAVAFPALVFIGYSLWLRYVHGVPWALEYFSGQGTLELLARPVEYLPRFALRTLFAAAYIGLLTAPVILAQAVSLSVDRPRLIRFLKLFGFWFVALVGLAFVMGKPMPYLFNSINREGFGTLTMLGHKTPITPDWVFWLATIVTPFAGAAYATLWSEALLDARRESAQPGAVLLLASLFMAVLILGVFVYFWDEYLFVFVPAGLYLALRFGKIQPRGWIAALVACAAFAVYGLIEQSEHMAWNAARWEAGDQLVAQGVAPEAIDGGLEWVGWHTFETALPEAIAEGKQQELWAWYFIHPFEYALAFEPQPGYAVVNRVMYRNPVLSRVGYVYVLKPVSP